MPCKYLSDSGQHPSCLAYHQLMTPSVFELQTLCYGNPADCMIYREKESSSIVSQAAEIKISAEKASEDYHKAG